MTVRSVSWTDAQRVAALLSQLAPARRSRSPGLVRTMRTAPATNASLPAGALAPAARAALPARSGAQALDPRSMPGAAAPASPEPAAPITPPKLDQTADNPSERLDALLAWTLEHHPCTGVFVADDNGLTLAAHGISEAHVSIVGPLLSSLIGIRTVPGIDATAGSLWLGAQMMSWVEVRTERGGFCLGTVGPEALPARSLEHLKEALAATVRGL